MTASSFGPGFDHDLEVGAYDFRWSCKVCFNNGGMGMVNRATPN